MKLLRKISVGAINGVRGGFKNVPHRIRVMTLAGIAHGYKEKASENMSTSYAFSGEFRAINLDGEECAAGVAYVPEPMQSMLKAQIDNLQDDGASAVEFGFHIFAVPDADAIRGYVFETEPLTETKPSTALESLAARIGFQAPESKQAALGLETEAPKATGKKAHK